MRRFTIILLVLIANVVNAAGGTITVTNHTTRLLHVALYYAKTNAIGLSIGPAIRAGSIKSISPDQKILIIRPSSRSGMRRELIFSVNRSDLVSSLSIQSYKMATKAPAGTIHGTIYHIGFCDERLCGYDEISWRLIKPVEDFFKNMSNTIAQRLRKKFLKHKYGATKATVRVGKTLARQEIDAVNKRSERARSILETRVGERIADVEMPRIAICLSGGGARMAVCSFGLIAGLDDIGLLDAVLYAAALSGSTWMLVHYLSLGLPINEYQEQLFRALTQLHTLNPSVVSQELWKKLLFSENIGLVDLYGVYLANSWFRNIKNDADRQKVLFSDLAKRVDNGDWIFPLCTAIETSFDYNWFTFTPYEIGSESTGIFIPTWAFGRKFDAGKSVDFAPEPSLGYFMGLWGSSLSGTVGDILQRLGFATNLPGSLGPIIRELIYSTKADDISFAAAKVFNIGKRMQGPYKALEKMTFLDAGYDSYLPFPPLLNQERSIDMIIVLDASLNVHSGVSSLHDAQEYAHAKGLSFPAIDYTDITHRFISVFSDKNDPKCPTVIFLVPVKNDKYDSNFDPSILFTSTYSTTKFTFTRAQVEKLIGLIRKSISDNKEIIMQAIKDKIKQKRDAAFVHN